MDDNNLSFRKKEKSASAFLQKKQTAKGTACHHCGAIVPNDAEICPQCKYPTHDDHCTFCGALVFPEDRFCAECGNPVGGIKCPKCGAMNFRGFCYNCHEPLTENAQAEIAKAQHDPQFLKAKALAKEIEELTNALIDEANETKLRGKILSQADKELIDSYQTLLNNLEKGEFTMSTIPTIKPNTNVDEKHQHVDLSQKITELNKKVTDLTNILKSFEPDPQVTPQLQRDYCSARKIKIVTKGKEVIKTGWKCNFCGYVHNNPEECDKPKLGGEWKYKEIEVDQIAWIKQ